MPCSLLYTIEKESCMFFINVIITIIALYFAKQEYERGRVGWAMFWSALLGWDIHTLLSTL